MNRENVFAHQSNITQQQRQIMMGQKGIVIWLTGLSGSGKSTISFALEKELLTKGRYVYCLDGDNLRMGINSNLGFSEQDRAENIRRIAHIAKLFLEACFIAVVSCISPLQCMREHARELIGAENFVEVYVHAALEECQRRDPKGLYKKARQGSIQNFTGIGANYEVPDGADIVLDTEKMNIKSCVNTICEEIEKRIEEDRKQ